MQSENLQKTNSKSIAVGAQCQLSFEVDEGVFEVVVVGIVLAPNKSSLVTSDDINVLLNMI